MAGQVSYERYEEVKEDFATFADACAFAVEHAAEKGGKVLVSAGPGERFLISVIRIEDAK